MAKIQPATQYDTHLHIFGSGALVYPWYGEITDTSPDDYLADPATYDGWTVTFSEMDICGTADEHPVHPGARPVRQYILDHAQILKAIKRAAFGNKAKVSATCAREARNFLFRRDDTDFDSDTADQIIQVAAFGEVLYG